MTTEELSDATEAGEVVAEDLLPKLSEELMKMANEGGQLEEAMNNTGSAINRFGNNVFLANAKFNEAGFDKGIRNLMNTMSDFIMRSDELWKILGSTAGFLANALRAPFELFTQISEALGIVTEKGEELNLSYNQMVGIFLSLFKWGRKLLAVFVLLPYTISAIARAWDEGGIGNWSIALGAAAFSALMFRKRIKSAIDHLKSGKDHAENFRRAFTGETGTKATKTVSETAKKAARSISDWDSARSGPTIWERMRSTLQKSVSSGVKGRLPVLGLGEGSKPEESEFLKRRQEIPWWDMMGRLESAQQEQNRQMIVQGDIRFEIEGTDGPQIADEVIRIINDQLIRPTSINEPSQEK